MKKVTTTAENLHRITRFAVGALAALLIALAFALASCAPNPYREVYREQVRLTRGMPDRLYEARQCHLERTRKTVEWCEDEGISPEQCREYILDRAGLDFIAFSKNEIKETP